MAIRYITCSHTALERRRFICCVWPCAKKRWEKLSNIAPQEDVIGENSTGDEWQAANRDWLANTIMNRTRRTMYSVWDYNLKLYKCKFIVKNRTLFFLFYETSQPGNGLLTLICLFKWAFQFLCYYFTRIWTICRLIALL